MSALGELTENVQHDRAHIYHWALLAAQTDLYRPPSNGIASSGPPTPSEVVERAEIYVQFLLKGAK